MTNIPIQVYGINLLVRLLSEAPADVRVHCPKGSPIRYGEVVARGDGFDEGANAFREMPALKTSSRSKRVPRRWKGTTSTSAAKSSASFAWTRSSSRSRPSSRPRRVESGPE
jgi:hypothetical protein